MDKRIEKLINKMQENAAKIPKPTRNIEEDNRIEQALKNTTTRPETKKFLENMIAANAYANAQLQMEDMANLAKELSEKYPLKESDPYFSFVSYEDDNEHPAMQHIGKLSLRAADELLVAMDMQIRENRNAIKEELKWAGEENIENNPRYKAWDVKFPTEYQVYDSENNLIADMPFPMGYETEEKDRVEKYDKYGLFADLLKTRGSLFQYSLDKEKELQLERNTLLEKQKKGIVMDINGFPIDIELTRNKEDIEKNQYRKAELKKDIREIFEFREQCYGTEIPKQLDMEVPESIIPALTNSIDSYEWERQERERNKEFSIGDHVRCLKDGKIILGKIVDIDIMALGDWSPRTWSIQPDGSKEIVDIEELFVYDYILEKDNFKEEKEMENKEGKSVGEKWLKEQGKMVDYIENYVDRNGKLPWNSDDFPKKVAQENGKKGLDLMYEGKDTGKARFSDFNQLKLSLVAMEKGYKDNRWVTYEFIQDRDAYLRKGERAEKVFLMTTSEQDNSKLNVVKYQNVFNVQQTGMLPMPAVQEQPLSNKIHLIDEVISKKPELQAEVEANKTPKDKYNYAQILHNLGRGEEISAKPGPEITKDASPEEIRKEIVAEISSAFLKQTFKSNVSEKERPNKLDPKIAVDYLKTHPEEMGAICKEAEMNRQNAITYLKSINKELAETKEQVQEKTPEIKKEKVTTKKKENKGMEM